MARRRGRAYYKGSIVSPSAEVATANAFAALSEGTTDNMLALDRIESSRHVEEPPDQQKVPPVATWSGCTAGKPWADYNEEDDEDFFAHVAPLFTPPLLQTRPLGKSARPPKRIPCTAPTPVLEAIQEEEEEEDGENPVMPSVPHVQNRPPSKQTLTKNEQRKRELLAQLVDSVLAGARSLTAKQQEKSRFKQGEGQSGSPAPAQPLSTKRRGKASSKCMAMTDQKPRPWPAEEVRLARAKMQVQESSVDHSRLAATSAKGSEHRQAGIRDAVSGLPSNCQAAVVVKATASCRVAAAKKIETSKMQQNHYTYSAR